MPRIIVYFRDNSPPYVNLVADTFYDCDGYIKVFNGTEQVGMFATDTVRAVYKSEEKEKKNALRVIS